MAAALAGEGGTAALPPSGEYGVVAGVARVLGWMWNQTADRWVAWIEARPGGRPPVGDELRLLVRALAAEAGKDPDAVAEAARAYFADPGRAAERGARVAQLEAEAEAAAGELRAARERAAAAAVYADGDAVDRVMRVESHLTRQLGLTLDLLARLRGEACSGAAGVGALLRAIPSASVRSLPASAAVGSFRNGGGADGEEAGLAPAVVPLRGRG